MIRRLLAPLALSALIPCVLPAATAVLENDALGVELDPDFPRVVRYRLRPAGGTLDARPTPAGVVEVNGKAEPCKVSFRKVSSAVAEYRLSFPKSGIAATLKAALGDGFLELKLESVAESGAVKLRTLAFPDNALLTTAPGALISTFRPEGHNNVREQLERPAAALHPGDGSYFFVSQGGLAAGVYGNHFTDSRRLDWKLSGEGAARTCSVQNPVWAWREIDSETVEAPWVKVFVTGDRNGDGRVNWQDAALVCRRSTPAPYGREFVPRMVADQIAMNFASGAQQPFLRILDNIKRAYLVTDGLGQQVTVKGFSSEGHDSANTDYAGHPNVRAGGVRDLNFLLENAGRYETRVGIHINATEAYPEAHRYDPAILTGATGWVWLDRSVLIDKRKDVLSGNLYAALEAMRAELPKLDFVYLDVYMDNGWPAWKTASKLRSLRLPLHTEYSGALDPWVSWAHWRAKSDIIRFLRFNDTDIGEPDPILRGGRNDKDGFMGWQNCHKFGDFVYGTFTRNLPAKYLKNFELLSWEPGKSAVFAGGLRAEKQGERIVVTRNGAVVMSWKGNGDAPRQFIPWPALTETKIYAWDYEGGAQTWELPASWKKRSLAKVYLYRLTDQGRVDETVVPVSAGRVTLTLEKNTPFVVYPQAAPARKPMEWGEGGFVKNPGFDSITPDGWTLSAGGKPAPDGAVSIETDSNGNRLARVNSAAPVRISQTVSGLEPGKTYAATVWTQVKGERRASLEIAFAGTSALKPEAAWVSRTDVRHSAPNDPRTGSKYQRLRTRFTVPAGGGSAELALVAAAGAPGSAVEFDDVRIAATGVSPEAAGHWFFEDFENVESGGYGPFTDCPDEYTHLSEANPPHTKDVIAGKFSLKTRGKGFIARTVPSSLRFAPDKLYRLSVDTLTDGKGAGGRLVFNTKGRRPVEIAIPEGRATVRGEFSTGGDTESFLAFHKDGGDAVILDNLAIDEIGAAKPATAEDVAASSGASPGAVPLLEEGFAGKLSSDWKRIATGRHKTEITSGEGALTVRGFANVTAAVERTLPPGVTEATCHLAIESDDSYTWGPGMALVWADGRAISLNVRPGDKCYGADATGFAQIKGGRVSPGVPVTLRLRLTPDKVYAEALSNTDNDYQIIATFPRASFSGSPAKVRLGKAHGVEGLDDHTEPGSESVVSYDAFHLFGAGK